MVEKGAEGRESAELGQGVGIDSLMRAGAPAESLEEQMALRAVEARLFGRPRDPVRFARYVLLDRLGEGASGLVYEAYDPTLDRAVAIKLLQSHAERAGAGAERLLAEAQALARLSHPNVVGIYDARAYDERDLEQIGAEARSEVPRRGVFIVMERLRGVSLRAWAAQGPQQGGPSLATRGRVLAAAGRGLMAAHAAGLVHRDFKPDNVVVLEGEGAKVVDFGLAAPTGEDSSVTMRLVGEDAASASGLAVVGTPAYMAPEQHVGEPADARSDQYAFACTAFEVLTGMRPFTGATPRALAEEKNLNRLRWPSGHQVSRKLMLLLERALRAAPRDRLDDLTPLIEALDPKPRRRAWGMMLGGLGLGAGLLALASVPDTRAECEAQVVAADELWGPDQLARVEAAIMSSGLSYADEAASSVRKGMDTWRGDWKAARRSACGHLDSEGDVDERRMRVAAELACLERRLYGARAVVGMLEGADATVVQHAAVMVRELEAPSSCLQSPPENAKAPIGNEAAAALARARALRLAAKYEDAKLRLSDLEREANATASGSLLARIHYERGWIAMMEGRLSESESAFSESVVAGQRAGDLEVVAEGLAKLAWVVGVEQQRGAEGERYAQMAEASLATIPSAEARWAELDHTRGGLAYAQGQHELALAHYRRALERSRASLGAEHPAVARTHSHLANVLISLKRFPEAREQAQRSLDLRTSIFGSTHPILAGSHNNLAVIAWRMGERDATFDHLARAREVAGPVQNSGYGIALVLSAQYSRDLGRTDEAKGYWREHVRWAGEHLGEDHPSRRQSLREIRKLEERDE